MVSELVRMCYVYKFDRVTYRLFQSGVDEVEVGIEDIDDVSVHYDGGKEIDAE